MAKLANQPLGWLHQKHASYELAKPLFLTPRANTHTHEHIWIERIVRIKTFLNFLPDLMSRGLIFLTQYSNVYIFVICDLS